jgi:DNA-binding HxlR family transcriptional regulator
MDVGLRSVIMTWLTGGQPPDLKGRSGSRPWSCAGPIPGRSPELSAISVTVLRKRPCPRQDGRVNHRPHQIPAERDPLDVAYDVFDRNCPSRATLDHVTGRWGMLVLAALLEGTLRSTNCGAASMGWARTCCRSRCERDGLVERTQSSVMPPRKPWHPTRPRNGDDDRPTATPYRGRRGVRFGHDDTSPLPFGRTAEPPNSDAEDRTREAVRHGNTTWVGACLLPMRFGIRGRPSAIG